MTNHLYTRQRCSGKDQLSFLFILHLSRAQTTVPINTKFWKIDNVGEMKKTAKFGCDRF